MSVSRKVILCCVFVLLAEEVFCNQFDNCRYLRGSSQINLENFENNSPRNDELIRTKVLYKLEIPFFSVLDHETNNEIVFGKYFRYFYIKHIKLN